MTECQDTHVCIIGRFVEDCGFSICGCSTNSAVVGVCTTQQNIMTDQTQSMLAIGTAYVQGEDVAAKGRIILVSVGQGTNDPSTWVCLHQYCHCRNIPHTSAVIISFVLFQYTVLYSLHPCSLKPPSNRAI